MIKTPSKKSPDKSAQISAIEINAPTQDAGDVVKSTLLTTAAAVSQLRPEQTLQVPRLDQVSNWPPYAEPFITIKDAAARIGQPYFKVLRFVNSGAVPTY